jgi:hypothetical protein
MGYPEFAHKITLTRTLISIIVMCVFAGCTTLQDYKLYEGPQLPDDKVSILINKGETIVVHSIDGKKSPSDEKVYSPGRFAVLPEEHSLNVSFYRISTSTQLEGHYYYDVFHKNTSISNIDVNFETESGHQYLLTSKYDYKDLQWSFVLLNETTNERVVETGPYPLDRVRIGDNKQIRRLHLRGR